MTSLSVVIPVLVGTADSLHGAPPQVEEPGASAGRFRRSASCSSFPSVLREVEGRGAAVVVVAVSGAAGDATHLERQLRPALVRETSALEHAQVLRDRGSAHVNGAASTPTVIGPSTRRSTDARRVGCASAAYTDTPGSQNSSLRPTQSNQLSIRGTCRAGHRPRRQDTGVRVAGSCDAASPRTPREQRTRQAHCLPQVSLPESHRMRWARPGQGSPASPSPRRRPAAASTQTR